MFIKQVAATDIQRSDLTYDACLHTQDPYLHSKYMSLSFDNINVYLKNGFVFLQIDYES